MQGTSAPLCERLTAPFGLSSEKFISSRLSQCTPGLPPQNHGENSFKSHVTFHMPGNFQYVTETAWAPFLPIFTYMLCTLHL